MSESQQIFSILSMHTDIGKLYELFWILAIGSYLGGIVFLVVSIAAHRDFRADLDALTQRLDLHQGTACPGCGARQRIEAERDVQSPGGG